MRRVGHLVPGRQPHQRPDQIVVAAVVVAQVKDEVRSRVRGHVAPEALHPLRHGGALLRVLHLVELRVPRVQVGALRVPVVRVRPGEPGGRRPLGGRDEALRGIVDRERGQRHVFGLLPRLVARRQRERGARDRLRRPERA